jgi:predicted metal-dependent phosphoesterase TrpH
MTDATSKIAAGKPKHTHNAVCHLDRHVRAKKQRTAGAADAGEGGEVASLRTTIAALQEAWETGNPPGGWQEAAELIPM